MFVGRCDTHVASQTGIGLSGKPIFRLRNLHSELIFSTEPQYSGIMPHITKITKSCVINMCRGVDNPR